tara:strand:+ start:3242 stop:5125 length:1884 start_codon:yes stop_codon:yes gene_type:complete
VKSYRLTINIILFLSVFFTNQNAIGQLGFCNGNSGDIIFSETFGTGIGQSALPAGTSSYTYSNGSEPEDGFYTVSNTSNFFDWFILQDHTLDDVNGKMLVINSDFTTGEFYRTTINGLCVDTSYEFSSWLVNLTPSTGFCGSGAIPINVSFEIWDSSDTNLLASGSTGNLGSLPSPEWLQYGLVFQTLPGQTSVILKMKNNGVGGCGNDLAIDDIVFKSCGDNISIADASASNMISLCSSQTPFSTSLTVTPDNSVFSTHFYQWEESLDGTTWTDIIGETTQNITINGITNTRYYRSKVAESVANLNNNLCNVVSEVFQVDVTPLPPVPTLACWETATVNNTTCLWDIVGTQPIHPIVACWETAIFNAATCAWEVSGTQPLPPSGLECWETTIFNTTTCVWDIIGDQPFIEETEFVNFCQNETITLHAITDIISPTYIWDTGQTTSFLEVDASGIYTVEVTDGCLTTIITFTVAQLETPLLDTITSNGNHIVVNTSNTGDFEYSIDGINYQNTNVFFNIEGGLYTIYIKANGCDDVVTTSFLHFYIPQFFTPNNDTKHDTFDLKGIQYFQSSEVYIYDRFGKLLKSSKNKSFSWDGTFNGSPMPTSDYWYVIIIDGQRRVGHFTLKR